MNLRLRDDSSSLDLYALLDGFFTDVDASKGLVRNNLLAPAAAPAVRGLATFFSEKRIWSSFV